MKLPLWKSRVAERNFVNFPTLDTFVKENSAVLEDGMIDKIQILVTNYLDLLIDNLESYFPKEQSHYLEKNSWVIDVSIY